MRSESRHPLTAGESGRLCTARLAATLLVALPVLPACLSAQSLNPDLIRAQCEVVHQIPDQSILYGYIIDSESGTPLPGGTVHLSWVEGSGADSTVNRAAAESPNGSYVFCDVPQGVRLTLWADALGKTGGTSDVLFEGGESERRDIPLGLAKLRGSFSGRLLDGTTGQPIQGATITIDNAGASALSDRNGAFVFRDLPVGAMEARIEHVAYGQPLMDVVVEPDLSTHSVIRLDPRPIAVEPLSVQITMREQWLEENGFYERVESNQGQFVTPEMIERTKFRRFTEVLRNIPGIVINGAYCAPRCLQWIEMAGSTQSNCVPEFYMDGRRMIFRGNGIDLDAIAGGQDLAAVEVYRGISETPPQFYGRCGSIVIWTKRGKR
jgi:hypothetical protein